MKWMKKNLVTGNPVVNFVMCKGDDHENFGAVGTYDHLEPFWGVYSNHDLSHE